MLLNWRDNNNVDGSCCVAVICYWKELGKMVKLLKLWPIHSAGKWCLKFPYKHLWG